MINEASESFSVQSSKQLEPIGGTWVALGGEIKVTPFHSSKVLNERQCAGKHLTGSQKKERERGRKEEEEKGVGEKERRGRGRGEEEEKKEKKDDVLICSLCQFP